MVKSKKKQGVNPYLPSWEYIPDGEPHVYDGRVYVFGSHDRFNGYAYCQNNYVCWSAPVEDLSDWKYEGLIFEKSKDPKNADSDMNLFAPDVTKGPDGRYYLYYVLNRLPVVSVAVCDEPAGSYEFYGYVKYEDGTLLGEKKGDQPQFDPGVLTEGDVTYLYTGFCMPKDASRNGAMVTVLDKDMLTITKSPKFIVPSVTYGKGSGYEGHEFFEASSMRKVGETYYFIYSSVLSHELCYATSEKPDGDFVFRGTIVSNNDSFISTYKPAYKTMAYGGNNHGGIEKIQDKWYIFYHRHTNGTNFSRQGCIEEIKILEDGLIPQVEITSSGPNGRPLEGKGEYPAYIACHLQCKDEAATVGPPGDWMDCRFPKITQEGRDGDELPGYIANMRDGAYAGFKYFTCEGVRSMTVKTRGKRGHILVKTSWDGEAIGIIEIANTNEWSEFTGDVSIPDGVTALYLEYKGEGYTSLLSFRIG